MNKKIYVSTPSRICLFGEHQDYLGLEVIAAAINLRFYASIVSRPDKIIYIKITSNIFSDKNKRNNTDGAVVEVIDLEKPIIYENDRDYLKSTVNLLMKNGYKFDHGFDIEMNSEIPIGKGMSSSTTMIVALIKALLEAINSEDKDDCEKIARLGYLAEVEEFGEPGGMMDHFSSAVGGLVHIKFSGKTTEVQKINAIIPGSFILFDSLQIKDTTKVLANSKYPVINALKKLEAYGISSVRDFDDESRLAYLEKLEDEEKTKLHANIDNYKILKEAMTLISKDRFSVEELGIMLKRHHENLRDGLNISTPVIEKILETAYEHGALGGKVNGSGGGGCCYVYARDKDCEEILRVVQNLGYPGIVLKQDSGVRNDREEIV